MANSKKSSKKNAKNSNKLKSRAMNAFNIAVDDQEYITGTRQQQDIDLEDFADKRIKDLLDGAVKPEDDEELDSDELGGDESDYGLDVGEPGSDWGESLDEDELVDLSTALDMAIKSDEDNEMSSDEDDGAQIDKQVESIPQADSEEDEDSAEDDHEGDQDSDQDSDIFSNSDNSDSEPEDSTALLKAIGKINDKSIAARAKLDKFAVPENPNMMPSRDTKLSLDDLTSSSKKELKLLRSKVKPKTLEMPLPERIKARGDRAAAYDLAKEEVSKWEDTVKENRRAEHLSFPINAPAPREQANPFVPASEANELESKVDELLEKSQIKDEKALSAFEESAPSNLSFEEMKKRRQELRMMRELMFREEQKAKRIKKIKSKSYRRVHKKEREKQEQLLREAGELSDDDPEDASRKRALERASLKHKTSSKWAKRMIETGMSKDESTRAELDAMLQQGESLRSRVTGEGNNDSDSDDGSDVFEFRSEEEDTVAAPQKGLMGMKFMQNAEKRQREENRKLMQESDDEQEEAANSNIGRRSYGPGRDEIAEQARQSEKRAQEEADLDDEKAMSNRLAKKHKHSRQQEDRMELRYSGGGEGKGAGEGAGDGDRDAGGSTDAGGSASANPWLNITAPKSQSTFQSIDKDSSQATKAASKLSKAKAQGKKGAGNNADINVNDTLNLGMVRKDQLTFEQRDLIRKAFAGDDVVAEFEAEKAQVVQDDGDKEVDETLPGWGSWGGEGLKPKVQRIRHVKGVDAKKRKDYKKDGVIISEKLNKKINRYAASAVPFPYENAAQYERSLRTPIGNEWATRDTFQRQTKPRVMVKKGEIIDPIKRKS